MAATTTSETATARATPDALIVGAGPGGLTCARILQQGGWQVTVLDGETGPQARGQGGSLDLQTESGQWALARAGLSEQFAALTRPEGQSMRILDSTGAVLLSVAAEAAQDTGNGADAAAVPSGDPSDQPNPEIDRGQLRDLLLDSLAAGTVHWGERVTEVRVGAGGATVHTAAGEHRAELLIGADGAWSKVRRALAGNGTAEPEYSGISFVEGWLSDIEPASELAALVGDGSMSAAGVQQKIVVQRSAFGRARVTLQFRDALDWAERDGVDTGSDHAVRRYLHGRYAGWAGQLTELIDACDDGFTVRPVLALPVPHRWRHQRGVTLLGDAAHLMSPFTGMGANSAMLDGAELAIALLTTPDDPDAGLRRYEQRMFPRASAAAAAAREGLQRNFSDRGAAGVLAYFAQFA